MRKRRRLIALAAVLAMPLGGGVASGLAAAPAQAASCGTGGTTFISTHTTDGRTSFTDSNNWGGGNACLDVPDTTSAGGGAFDIQSQTTAWTGSVLAAPEIMIGCRSGSCTASNGLDETVATDPDPQVTTSYTTSGANASTSAYDQEINENWSTDCTATDTSPAAKTVIGVYLNAHYPSKTLLQSYVKLGLANTGSVTIDGITWYLLHVEHGTGASATYKVEFAAQSQQTSTTALSMKAFTDYITANQSGWTTDGTSFLRTTDCLRELDVDDEVWEGSAGLAIGATGITGP